MNVQRHVERAVLPAVFSEWTADCGRVRARFADDAELVDVGRGGSGRPAVHVWAGSRSVCGACAAAVHDGAADFVGDAKSCPAALL